MTVGMIFWLLMILLVLFGLFGDRIGTKDGKFQLVGGNLLLFALLFLLGVGIFGWPIKG